MPPLDHRSVISGGKRALDFTKEATDRKPLGPFLPHGMPCPTRCHGVVLNRAFPRTGGTCGGLMPGGVSGPGRSCQPPREACEHIFSPLAACVQAPPTASDLSLLLRCRVAKGHREPAVCQPHCSRNSAEEATQILVPPLI